jgi:glycosyltransferase involved in cell wall biosynthesis
MTPDPLISVLLPVHNGMPHLPEAVESVLGQTLKEFELLVIDDGSTDGTPDYLRSLALPRVRYHRLTKVGLVGALNYGLGVARAPLVARMDADDVSLPTRFEKQCAYLRRHPDCVLVGCHFEYMSLEGHCVREHSNLISDEAIRWQMLFTTPFVHPGVMFSRSAAAAVGNYRTEFPIAQDYDLWTRMATQGRLANYPEKLLRYRCNPVSVSERNSARQRDYASQIAGAYAAAAIPEVEATSAQELYMFLAAGVLPESRSIGELAVTFRAMKRYFLDSYEQGPELLAQIKGTQERFRWRCLDRCRQNAWRPRRCLQWLRWAREFDPEGASLPRLLKRRLSRLASAAPSDT